MPSISQTIIPPVSGKKRRRDDDAGSVLRISSPRHALHDTTFHNAANRDDPPHLNPERKQLAPRRRLHEQKRQRIEVADLPSRETDLLDDSQIKGGPGAVGSEEGEREVVKPKIDLSPCHVCWRKPTEKSQLDSYAYCEGCGNRACYVCMRECEGLGGMRHASIGVGEGAFSFEFDSHVEGEGQSWQAFGGDGELGKEGRGAERVWERDRIEGHRSRICSRCCVERGVDGEVCCLGCLRAEEGVS